MNIFSAIANYLSGASKEEESTAIKNWRSQSPDNEAEFQKFERLWQAASPEAKTFQPDVNQAWKAVTARIALKEEAKQPQTRVYKLPLYRQSWFIAAAVSTFIMAAAGYWLLQSQHEFSSAGMAQLKTATKEKQEIILADGSRVWLNQSSTLTYPEQFSDSLRKVQLEGEAFFEVASMPDKPFIIEAGSASVQVLGTSFNLIASQETALQVLSGKVSIKTGQDSLILTAGEAALSKDLKLLKVKPDPNTLAWKTGHFRFEDASLEQVLASLQTYYPIEIEIRDDKALHCRLYAEFRQQPIEEVLKTISLTLKLDYNYQKAENKVVFYSKADGCVTNL